MANRYRWEILVKKRREEAKADVILGVFVPLAIISFSILWGIFNA